MPYEQVLPTVFPSWESDIIWPHGIYDRAAIGAAATGDVRPRSRTNFPANTATQSYIVATTQLHVDPNWAMHNGLGCVSPQPIANESAFFFGVGQEILGPVDNEGYTAAQNFPCASPLPSWDRVWIDEFLIAFSTAAITHDINNMVCSFVPGPGGGGAAFFGDASTHYGLRGDGAGDIEFYSTIGGILQETVTLVWPNADMRIWVRVIVEHQTANVAGSGQLRIFLNNQNNLAISRNWNTGTTLPNFTTWGGSRSIRRYFGQEVGETPDSMFFAMFRTRMGRHTYDGTELS